MLRMSEKFEFSASHRLYDPKLGDEQNQRIYGRCSNPLGHGHNYELQVTLALGAESAEQSGAGKIIPALESIVAKHVIERFDHRNLNLEIEEFKTKIPSVENIAAVIYGLLKPAIAQLPGARLAAVTVWETPKTWCEYSE
jgi:6-pyruvoyltetrahydropterin/6-carboxytetrahydropterin synthase